MRKGDTGEKRWQKGKGRGKRKEEGGVNNL